MANYNIEMNSFNGTSYDVLYPRTLLNNVTNWSSSIYNKSQVDSKINELNSDISSLESSITSINRDITSIESDIKDINGSFGLLNISRSDYKKTSTSEISIGVAGPNVLFWAINPTNKITLVNHNDNRGDTQITANMWTIFVNNNGKGVFKPLLSDPASYYNYFDISTTIYAGGSNTATIRVLKISSSLL